MAGLKVGVDKIAHQPIAVAVAIDPHQFTGESENRAARIAARQRLVVKAAALLIDPDIAGHEAEDEAAPARLIAIVGRRRQDQRPADQFGQRLQAIAEARRHAEIAATFEEDRVVVEAQQRMFSRFPDRPTIHIRSDAGGVQARRVIQLRVQTEQAA